MGLAIAAILGVAEIANLPSERTVVVRVADGQRIDRVELVWHDGDEIVHTTELAPPFAGARSAVRLSDGDHRLELNVHRGDQVTHDERRIEVRDDADEIVIDVR